MIPSVRVSFLQFGLMLRPEIILAILYAGILASGLACTLRSANRKVPEPAAVSLLLCSGSVFSVPAGFIFLHGILAVRELSGCG